MAARAHASWIATLCMACGSGGSDSDPTLGEGSQSTGTENPTTSVSTTMTSATTTTATTATSTTADTTADTSDTSPALDVGFETESGGPVDVCNVGDEMDAVIPCVDEAPPDSFEPVVQWSWTGPEGRERSTALPLVANLTDDNADGAIDLCDVPDIVVLAFDAWSADVPAHLYVLDGASGTVHYEVDLGFVPAATPALGDIDGDGISEILVLRQSPRVIVALEHDGTLAWQSPDVWTEAGGFFYGALALADLDADGDVEILGGSMVWDHEGAAILTLPDSSGQPVYGNSTTAADLDGDDDLEIVLGQSAYHHDGTVWYDQAMVQPSHPQVANLDDDADPEVLAMSPNGISVLEHDGAVKYLDLRPTGAGPGLSEWFRAAAVHDFDGDGVSDFAVSSSNQFAAYSRDASILWTAMVSDGMAGGGGTSATAFDFLGDGLAEAIYGDENSLYAFDDMGDALFTTPRTSDTLLDYPVVADVDNDGSAEIVTVSSQGFGGEPTPTVQVIRDADDRWIPARRIWNQHTYHVTNVREDGTIPQIEPKHWTLLNTFRTQAQIIPGGGTCQPAG